MVVTDSKGLSGTLPRGFSVCAVFRFDPAALRVPVGANRTTALYLDGLTSGLSGFNANLSLSLPDPSAGEIVDVSLPGWEMTGTSTLPADTVVISALDLGNIVGPGGSALIGTVTVRGDRVGQTETQGNPSPDR